MFHRKVCILGATSAVGQSLSLLLKTNPLVNELSLFHNPGELLTAVAGVATDLSHICTPTQVTSFSCAEDLGKALDGADIVLIPSCGLGAGRQSNPVNPMDQFKLNAGTVKAFTADVAKHAPNAQLCIISPSINYTVPIAAEVLKKAGAYDPSRLYGVMTLDALRAKTVAAGARGLSLSDVNVNVVGGHSDATIVPLLSQTGLNFTPEEAKALTAAIQAGIARTQDESMGALSMAYAGSEFCGSLLKAIRGDRGISECSFVSSVLDPYVPYFSARVDLGRTGICKVHPVGRLSPYEEELKHNSMVTLKKEIQIGIEFATR